MAAEEQIQAPGVEPLHVRHWSHHLRVHHVHVIPHFLLQEPAPEGRVITSAHLDLSLNEILKSNFFCFFFGLHTIVIAFFLKISKHISLLRLRWLCYIAVGGGGQERLIMDVK